MQHIKKIAVVLLLSTLYTYSKAQTTPPIEQSLIDAVVNNNTTLKAYKDKIEAAKIGTKVGLNPANPEAKISRTSNGSIYNQEIELTQEIDFPTVYVKKRNISKLEQQRLSTEYTLYRRNIVAVAYKTLSNYQYTLSMKALASERLRKAAEVQKLMKDRLDAGDILLIEFNKSKIETSLVAADNQKWEMAVKLAKQDLALYVGDVDKQMSQLHLLNTKMPLFNNSTEEKEKLKLNWIAQDSKVLGASFQKQISEQNIGLTKSQTLPKLTLGYRRDQNPSITMNGATAGISIPLWENKNKVKQAKAEQLFAESFETDARLKAELQFESVYQATQQNKALYQMLESNLPSVQTLNQLEESLQTGYIALLEYYTQIKAYYELEDKIESVAKDYKDVYIELYKIAL